VSRTLVIVAVLALALAWFAGLDHRKLVRADESRYGEIPREMVASGDWVTPRLNGFKYFEKPPLQYWATAASFEAFGVDEWTVRLWPALTGFAGVLLVFFAGARIFGREAGLYAAAALAGSLLYVALGHFVTLDMGVTLFLSLTVLAFVLAQLDGTPERERRGWMLVAWAAAAAAVLSKGLIGLVLPGGAFVLYLLARRDWGLLGRLHVVPGAAIFLVIAAPWFVAVSLANPEFARFFFIHEHFERFLTKVHERYEPAWYFLPVLAAGIMPWLVSFAAALWRGAREREPARFRPALFLLLWCATVLAFFSASDSKLASYILPLFPAAALLIGRQLAAASRALLVGQALLAALVGAAFVVLAPRLPYLEMTRVAPELLHAYAPWLVAAGTLLAALAAASAVLAWRGRRTASVLALAAAGLAFMQLAMTGRETLSPAYSAYHAVERARAALLREAPDTTRPFLDAPFYVVDAYDHTLPFYLGRTVTMVGSRDELSPSIAWEPQKFVADVPRFVELWRAAPRAYAAFRPAAFETIRGRYGLEARVLGGDANLVIVRKP